MHSLKAFREAKTILPHLDAILKVFDLSTKSLKHFKTYLPVAKVLTVMEEQKLLLETHRDRYKKILESKGREQ